MNTDARLLACALAVWLLTPGPARGQEPSPSPAPPSTDDTLEAGEALAKEPRRQLVAWNHYEGPYFTIRVGGGLLFDSVWYSQDEESQQQFPDLQPESEIRDARFVIKGRFFPKWERAITYSVGIMYDGPTDEFFMRETGIMVAVPELWGHFFVGRTKEGFSLNKVMVGYSGWTMERATISDATIPILADGIKWLGWLPRQRILWNLGIYVDWLSEGQGFSTYDTQLVGRLAWIPIADEATRTLLHVGVSGRYGKPNEGTLKLRSRPESFLSEYFVDTGDFAAEDTRMLAFEAYYRPGPLLVGTEYFVQWANAAEAGDPVLHGGDVVVSWLATGETRKYNTRGGFFHSVSPARTVFSGGPGAWELVLRASYIDLDDANLTGGRFWRITPMVNWHMSDNLRLEAAYGYGKLDRFDVTGGTQFLQTRVQVTF
jgi:phosphate-selective porin OprO/OprP